MQASMKLGEAMYQASQAAGESGEASEEPKKDDVIDADFQEVDDQDKKKRA
jgi:molecular chaperone DnaK